MSPQLQSLLVQIRQHPGFQELLETVQAPPLPRFQISQANEPEKARANWIFISGQQTNAERVTNLLKGFDK